MAKVAPVGEAPSTDDEEVQRWPPKGGKLPAPIMGTSTSSPKGAANEIAAARGANGDGGDSLMDRASGRLISGREFLSRRYGLKAAEEYKALLSEVMNSSKRAKLISVQGVLFGFTFMMSTFETSNR